MDCFLGCCTFAFSSMALGAFLFVIIGIPAAFVSYLVRVERELSQTATGAVGSELGLTEVAPEKPGTLYWFGGAWQKRPVGLCHHGGMRVQRYKGYRRVIPVTPRRGYRLVVAVQRDMGRIEVFRDYASRALRDETFEDAFTAKEGGAALNQDQREAFLAFSKDFGGLRLQDRASLKPLDLPPERMEGVPTVLIHEGYGNLSPKKARMLLERLVNLADQLERR